MKRFFPYLSLLIVAIALVLFESDYLYRIQEHNLFLHTPLFFRQCMVTAGGLLMWMGAYLTQYFYYPVLGAGLLCLLWAFLMFLLKQVFHLPDRWMMMTLVPVACLLLSVTDLGYWIYYLKLRGHAFDATLGMIAATGLVWLYRLLPRKYGLPTAFLLIATSVSYLLFGFYGLWAGVLMGVMAWRVQGHRVLDSLVAGLTIVSVPLVCYHALYHETNIVNIYWVGLPVFSHVGQRFFAYYIPYIVMLACTVLMAACYQKERKAVSPARWQQWAQAGVLSATVVCVVVFWYKDDHFHRELSMCRSIEQQDWEKVLRTSAKVQDEPTRAICMMQNLALFRLGRQGDEMYRYPNGAKQPDAPFPTRMVHTVGRLLYLQYGVPNYCYRWCMEDGVEYGWTVEKLKLMVKCSLLSGELEAARLYLVMLSKTDFHKDWAARYKEYVHNPQLIGKDKELQTIMHLQRQDNFLTADQSQMEKFLLEHFCTAESDDPLLQEQIMIAAMQTKNMSLFWRQFYHYTEHHLEARVPRHYQEAACLFGHLGHINVSHMPFDPMMVRDYEEFAATMGRYQQQGMKPEQIAPLVYNRFCNTYFYDFYFNHYNYIEP